MNKERHNDSEEEILKGPLPRHYDMAEEEEEEDTEDGETQSSVTMENSKAKIPKNSKTLNTGSNQGKEEGKKGRYNKTYLCSYVATEGIVLAFRMLILHVGLENWSHEWSNWDDVAAGLCELRPELVLDTQGTYQPPKWLSTLIADDPYLYGTNSYIFICYSQL